MLALIKPESVLITFNNPSKLLKPRFLNNFEILVLSRKQQHIRNQRT